MSSTEAHQPTAERAGRWRKSLVALSLAIAATVAVGVPAVSAQDGPSSTEAPANAGQRQARLEKACQRVPAITERVDRMIARLEGDASTRGSLAWLQTRVDAANDAGRDQLVTVLRNRLDVRTARLALLHERRGSLADIAQICDEKLGG